MRSCLAIFLVIIFIPITLASLLAFNLKITVLNPQFLKQQLAKSGVYTTLIKSIPDLLGSISQDADSQDLAQILKTLQPDITPQLLQETTEKFLDDYYLYLQKGQDLPKIDLSVLKNKLPAEALGEVLPDNYQLPQNATQQKILKNFRLFQNLTTIGITVSVLIGILLLITVSGGIPSRLKWLSAPILIVGILALGGSFLGRLTLSSNFVLEGLLGSLAKVSYLSFLPQILLGILRSILGQKIWESLAILGVGIFFLVLGIILSRKGK